jgi:hypothetical protein
MSPTESEAAIQEYIADFMARPDFQTLYGSLLTSAQASAFITRLEQTAGVTLANRNTLINEMASGQKTAAQTLRAFVDSPEVFNKFLNPGLIEMMYFGFLRRNSDPIGFANYMQKTGDIRGIVFDFLYSTEYRKRFGRP